MQNSAVVEIDNLKGITYSKEDGTTVKADPGTRVYGGGQLYWSKNANLTVGSTKVTIGGADTALEEVYGGGLISGTIAAADSSVLVTGHTDVIVNNGLITSWLVGGNNTNWFGTSVIGVASDSGSHEYNGKKYSDGSTSVTLNNGGGDNLSVVGGSLSDYANCSSEGGKRESMVFGTTNVNINGGKMFEVVGGGYAYYIANSVDESKLNDGAPLSNVVGTTNVNITDGTILDNVYGGGYAYSTQNLLASQANVNGDTNVTINGGVIDGDVYAGGGAVGDNTQANVTGKATVNITGGTINGAVYGGGYADGDGASATVGSSELNVKGYEGTIKAISGFDAVNITDSTLTTALQAMDNKDTVVVFSGATASLQGTLTADNAKLSLGGADGEYNVGKLITQNSGKILVTGGTLDINELTTNTAKFALEGESLVVTGKGVLKAASDKVFADKENPADGKVVITAIDDKVLFSGGKLAISDATYTLADSKLYSTALKAADSGQGKTTIVMTGNLQNSADLNNAGVEDLANTGAVHSNVTGTVSGSTLNVGSDAGDSSAPGVTNDLGVKDLEFSDANNSAIVNIGNETGLTLVGDGTGELLKGTSGTGNTITVGDSTAGGSAGTLTLGTTAATSGGTLNATVTVGHADAALNVEAGSFNVEKIEAKAGTVAVGSGAALATANLTVGTSSDTGTAATVAVTGSLHADTLTVNDSTATISVGDSGSAGKLTAANVKLSGASIVLDPVWQDGSSIQTASKGALEFASAVDGKLTVGQNSVLTLGTHDISKAEAVFANSGLNWGEQDITAALYIATAQTLDATNGGLKVDGSLTHSSTGDFASANAAYFANQSLLMVDSSLLLSNNGALKATNGTLTVKSNAKLYIENAAADQTYTVVSGFDNSSTVEGWNGANLLLNKLVTVDADATKFESGTYTVGTKKVKASEALPGIALPNILDAMAANTKSANAGISYLSNAISDLNTDAQTIAAVNGFAQGAENSGAAHSGTMAAFTIGDTIQSRMSLASDVAAPQGGKGKGTDAADNGSIWAQYIHNKDKVDNLGGISYDGQYNGVIIGGDFAPTGKYHSGVAFSYGSGSSNGSVSKNDFDFWGLSYYGGIKNDATNVIFDAGYSKTSNDIKGAVDIDSDTKVLTLGVKGEKLINNGHGTSYVPYAGLRYLNVDGGSYNGTIGGEVAANYSNDKANIWMLPVGIGVHHETVTASGWKVRPMADIAYVWTFGDNNSAMDVTVPGVNATDRLGYDIMDSGFFVGKLGVEAEKGGWTYGLGYAYQKGSHAQNNKFTVNVTYSF